MVDCDEEEMESDLANTVTRHYTAVVTALAPTNQQPMDAVVSTDYGIPGIIGSFACYVNRDRRTLIKTAGWTVDETSRGLSMRSP